MITNILDLYRQNNLISVDNQLLSGTRMDYCCAKCDECWEGIEEFKADWNKIFLPHVGSSYVNNRIAVFGTAFFKVVVA